MPRPAKPRWHPTVRRWYACIGEVGANGRRREVYAPQTIGERDESAAWEWFHAEQRRIADQVKPSEDGALQVAALSELYLLWAKKRRDEGKLAPSEFANKARHLGLFTDVFGARAAPTLTPDEMTEFGEGLMEDYSAVYSRNVCATARAALNWAVKTKKIAVNPIKGFVIPSVPRSPARYAERHEAAAFVGYWRVRGNRSNARGVYDRLTLLMERVLIRTGCRPMELCKLQWGDVQWRGWTTSAGHASAKAVIPPDRWKAGMATGKPRTIYFTPTLTRALRRVWERGAPNPVWVFVHAGGRGGVGEGEPWDSGSVLSKTILRVRRELIADQEEIRERIKKGEKVKPWESRLAAVRVLDTGADKLVNYRWRHTAISTLLMLGVDIATVAELTGTSPDMVYRHYGHLLDSHLQGAAEKLAGSRKRPG